MGNLVAGLLGGPVVTSDGLRLDPRMLVEPLTEFFVPLDDIETGSAGFPLVTRRQLNWFVKGDHDLSDGPVSSFTAALPVADESWVLVPDDVLDDVTFQTFEFDVAEGRKLLVPTVAKVAPPSSPDVLPAFLEAAAETKLWRRWRRRKAVTCVDTDGGGCFGERCYAGCGKVIWGDPDRPLWACYCPNA